MSAEPSPQPQETAPERGGLTIERLKEAFLKSMQPRQADTSWTRRYYREDVRFQDSVQTTYGLEAFIGVCERLCARCEEITLEVTDAAHTGNGMIVHWTMTMKYQGTTRTPLYGSSRLLLDDDGMIYDQRDIYDMWGDTFDVIPGVGKAYRKFVAKVFG